MKMIMERMSNQVPVTEKNLKRKSSGKPSLEIQVTSVPMKKLMNKTTRKARR